MAEIKFLPVCSKCKNIINDVIDCKKYLHPNDCQFKFPHDVILPSICKYCGSRFESIEIPTKLPFDNSHIRDISATDMR